MAITVAISGVDATQIKLVMYGTLTLSGNYGTASSHGDTINFASDSIKSQQPPTFVDIYEAPAAGASASGYWYNYSAGSGPNNGSLQIFGAGASAGAASQEYTQGSAYSGVGVGGVLNFRAEFPSFL